MAEQKHWQEAGWVALLAQSLRAENDYFPAIEGRIPNDLRGTLYRNGPGLFQRGSTTKRSLLDGDGMIQAFDFDCGKVRYRNRFVRTAKFLEEEVLGRFVWPTWSTKSPQGRLHNLGNRIRSQAGVTVVARDAVLYAFDEVGVPYALTQDTLDTLGERDIGPAGFRFDYKAHTKVDPTNGDWVLLGVEHGRRMMLHLVTRSAQGVLKDHQRLPAPRNAYLHDWFLTARYAVIMLQPLELSLPGFLLGSASVVDSLRWRADQPVIWLLIDRNGVDPPRRYETEARFMWHAANAFQDGDSLVADCVTYREPDHFLGEDAALRQIMQGRLGRAEYPGEIQRYRFDLTGRRATSHVISEQNHEFPSVDPSESTRHYDYAYFTCSPGVTVFHNGVARVNMGTGARDTFFLEDTHFGEPVVVPSESGNQGPWLLSLALDGRSGVSYLAIFQAAHVSDGPVARVMLSHPTPLSFHGYWLAR